MTNVRIILVDSIAIFLLVIAYTYTYVHPSSMSDRVSFTEYIDEEKRVY